MVDLRAKVRDAETQYHLSEADYQNSRYRLITMEGLRACAANSKELAKTAREKQFIDTTTAPFKWPC
ncbi:hypothetical protein ALI144C_35850 [Actinosynnema sp. ALI-1.44]|uniref:hypothetical protein n=1 Tax=Actinosynnema sp. ALI-1.44 TaxID=1933779 RepID=UPI00097C50BE|nr:hypothetical protein [Actinosynnema sp. ALI-1.44]ONI76075.1 hypothetical protein ALI144C_35850 [Actinosynnema sp. ALI-1.44]